MDPDRQGWTLSDNYRTQIEADATPDDLAATEPMTFAGGVDLNPTAQEIDQLPSMWTPVSPGLQHQLNSEFAPQLGLLAADPSPPPALFLPAQGASVHPVSNIPFLPPNAGFPWNGVSYSPQMNAETATVDPTSTVQVTGEVLPLLLPPAGTSASISPDADPYVPNAEGQALTSTNKRGFPTDSFQLEPAPKRTKIAELLPVAAEALDSDDGGDEPVSLIEMVGHVSSPTDVNDGNYDDTLNADGETDTHYVSGNGGSSHPPSAPASSFLPSIERNEESVRLPANGASVNDKARSGKPRKLLKEIEDTKGFAGRQGVEDGVRGRPVRKGARKYSPGQE